jgi:hypothetical protein
MSDLISREAVIKAMENNSFMVEAFGTKRKMIDGMMMCVEIADLPTVAVPQWIPCSERLPEPYISVLVCEEDKSIHLCRYHDRCNRFYYDGSDWDIKLSEVIAWMPLPQPYKGE